MWCGVLLLLVLLLWMLLLGTDVDLFCRLVRPQIVTNYCVALCWVVQYYFRGTPSWSWFYPHHYAPMLTDLVQLPTLMTSASTIATISEWFEYVSGCERGHPTAVSSRLLRPQSTRRS